MTSKKLQANSGTLQIGGTVSFDNAPSISGSGFVTLTDAQTVGGAKSFSSEISTDAVHRGGYGLLPVGAIVAYNPGYYTNGSNGGFAISGPAGNSATEVNAFLNGKGWYVCDGAALNNPASPIWNAAGRYLPNLDDGRFLRGSTSAGTQGGSASASIAHTHTFTLTANNLPQHTHSAGSYTSNSSLTGTTTFASSSHAHGMAHSHQIWRTASGSNQIRVWNSNSGSNAAVNNDSYGNVGVGGTDKPAGSGGGAVADFFDLRQPAYSSGVSSGPNGTAGSAKTGSPDNTASVGISNGVITGDSGNNTTTNTAVNTGDASVTSISIEPQYLNTFYIVRVF